MKLKPFDQHVIAIRFQRFMGIACFSRPADSLGIHAFPGKVCLPGCKLLPYGWIFQRYEVLKTAQPVMKQHSEKDKGIDEDGCEFFMTSGRKAIDVPENSGKELKDLKIIKKRISFSRGPER